MKILHVMAGGQHGGAETAFVDFCIAQQKSGENVQVITRPNELRVPQLLDAGIITHTARFGNFADILTPLKIKRIIRSFQPDIVQTWMSRASHKVPGRRSSQRPFRVIARYGGYYKTKYFKKVDAFVALTPDLKRNLVEQGVSAERVRQINNFAETEGSRKPVSRASLDTPEDSKVILTLGRLHDSKAFDCLIEAVKDLEDAVLWIAGEGPKRSELEALIAALSLQDRVKLLGWRSDRAALFEAADICVLPSRHEPFGTVFVQAWAHQTPLVTTASQGPSQFVIDQEDGLVVPLDDVLALRQAIERVMKDDELAQSLVRNGLKRYQSEFTKEKCLAGYKSFYREVLGT
jgi:glycosyltransferase involved in cell wall biosynthesis